ncbi:MAG: hypothetical protein DMG97_29660 [Acidobacteria bacterium]|nr:MAG: hypothetical protein DMG97_29660 [Acidobacteriota bacterium]
MLTIKQRSPARPEMTIGIPKTRKSTATPIFFSPGVLACSQRDESSKAAKSTADRPTSIQPVNLSDLMRSLFALTHLTHSHTTYAHSDKNKREGIGLK